MKGNGLGATGLAAKAFGKALLLSGLLALTWLAACGSEGSPEALGSLTLDIRGLPAGLSAAVSVIGPGGFSKIVSASTTLDKLAPGSYTVTASDVVQTDTYQPDKRQQNIVVRASETARLTLSYSKQAANTGSLEVTVSGLPAGADADVTLTGPDGFNEHLTTSSVLSNLKPGEYHLTAGTVSVGSDSYMPMPTSQTVGVAAGSKTDLSVTYAKQLPTVGQLAVTITGLPTGMNAVLTVTGPDGFSEDVSASKTLENLQPGNYALSASNVDGAYTYNPQPRTQTIRVLAGEAATAELSYVPTIPLPHDSADAFFGSAVAVEGDWMVVGAPYESSGNVPRSGFAYLYQRSASGEWQFVKQLAPPMGAEEDHFGYSVAINGNAVVVGAPNALTAQICDLKGNCGDIRSGRAYVFERNEGGPNNFGFVTELKATEVTVDADDFGTSVAVSGDTIAVGSPGHPHDVNQDSFTTCTASSFDECSVGAVYLFRREGSGSGVWDQVATLRANDGRGSDFFGVSVAADDDMVIAGAVRDTHDSDGDGTEECFDPNYSECFIGSAYLFERNQGGSNTWGQVKKLVPSDGQFDDGFGASVAISNDSVVVGTGNSDGGQTRVLTYIFERNQAAATSWSEVKRLSIAGVFEGFDAARVAMHGDVLVIGVPFMNSDINQDGSIDCMPPYPFAGNECQTGAALVFQRDQGGANNFGLVKTFVASDGASFGNFGNAVAISGGTIVAGSPGHIANTGAVYVFGP